MKIEKVEVKVIPQAPNPQPIRDALQALPGAGSVQVTVESEAGVTGIGEAGFGRLYRADPQTVDPQPGSPPGARVTSADVAGD